MTQGRRSNGGNGTLRASRVTQVGANPYVQYVADDTVDDGIVFTFPDLSYVPSLAGVRAWGPGGYIALPRRIIPNGGASGGTKNAVKCQVLVAANHTHANHTHSISCVKDAVVDGATTRINAAANKMGCNTGGDLTVVYAVATGGIVTANQTGGTTTADTNDELAAGQNIAGVTFYASAEGYP